MGGDFDIIPFMAKHRNHRKNKHNGLRGGSVTVVMEPEADTEKVEAEPERTEAEAAAEAVSAELSDATEEQATEPETSEEIATEPETSEEIAIEEASEAAIEAEPERNEVEASAEAESEADEAAEEAYEEPAEEAEAEDTAGAGAAEEGSEAEHTIEEVTEAAPEAKPEAAAEEPEAEAPMFEESATAEPEVEPETEDEPEKSAEPTAETAEEEEELDPEDSLPEAGYLRRMREQKAAKQRAERRPGSERAEKPRHERKPRAEKAAKPRPERKPKAERAEKPKPERKPKAEKAARPKPERKPKAGGGLLFGRKKNKKTVTLPAGTNPEIVKEPFASSAPAAEKKKRGPKKFNILFVTDDSKRVKTIRTSADAVLLCTIGAAIVILAVFVAIVWNSLKTEEYKAEIEGLKEEIVSLSEDKIILEAEIENLEQELGNMNSEISAKESQAQADTELQALQSIPSALPLNSQALPSEYDKEKHWITVDAGAGTHVVATGDGTVTYAGESVEAGGYLVTVDHGNGYETNYYCQSFPVVTQGAAVTRGTTLYVIADTDKLIYQIKYEGEFVDPYTVLNIAG